MPDALNKSYNHSYSFPKSFLFGSAVSSFQVEGNVDKTRRTDWDAFWKHKHEMTLTLPGPNWWTKGIAEKDIDQMARLGMNTIRISLEWARIEPEKGSVNKSAIDRYHQIIDYIQRRDMLPFVTLNHFTLPEWVAKRGGWENGKMPGMFAYFTELVVSHFTGVTNWITINEPNVLLQAGYLTGYFPPQKISFRSLLLARWHMIEAHKKAAKAIKFTIKNARVGPTIAFRWYKPENPQKNLHTTYAKGVNYLDSLNLVDALSDASDFIGCNYYTGYYLNLNPKIKKLTMRTDAAGIPKTILFGETKKPDTYTSDMGWPIVPEFFVDVLHAIRKRTKKPIIITENGIADHADQYRAFYLLTHLAALLRAIREGVDIAGYYHWSTIDNFEWLYGYTKHFGLIKNNASSQKRQLQKSAHLYEAVCKAHALIPNELLHFVPETQRKAAEDAMEKFLS